MNPILNTAFYEIRMRCLINADNYITLDNLSNTKEFRDYMDFKVFEILNTAFYSGNDANKMFSYIIDQSSWNSDSMPSEEKSTWIMNHALFGNMILKDYGLSPAYRVSDMLMDRYLTDLPIQVFHVAPLLYLLGLKAPIEDILKIQQDQPPHTEYVGSSDFSSYSYYSAQIVSYLNGLIKKGKTSKIYYCFDIDCFAGFSAFLIDFESVLIWVIKTIEKKPMCENIYLCELETFLNEPNWSVEARTEIREFTKSLLKKRFG